MKLNTIVGISLWLFFAVFGSIIIFGNLGSARWNSSALIYFQIAFFIFMIILFVWMYYALRSLIGTKEEHALVVITILIVSTTIALAAGKTKETLETKKYVEQSITQLDYEIKNVEQQNAYFDMIIKSMNFQASDLKKNRQALETQIVLLKSKIENKKPIVNETVIELPQETIYESPVTKNQVIERDYEGEEDD